MPICSKYINLKSVNKAAGDSKRNLTFRKTTSSYTKSESKPKGGGIYRRNI